MDGIIFDVDGTLWDSTKIVADAWDSYLKEVGVTDVPISVERLRSLFGQLLPDIAKNLFPDRSEEEQLRLIEGCCDAEHRLLAISEPPVYEGICETMIELSHRFPIFIVSNCQAGYIELFLERTGMGQYVTDHLCPGDTGVAKAANIRSIVKKHKLADPIYVGDTMGDFRACEEAGVPFVFAKYGFGEVPNPYATIEKPADLLTMCK